MVFHEYAIERSAAYFLAMLGGALTVTESVIVNASTELAAAITRGTLPGLPPMS